MKMPRAGESAKAAFQKLLPPDPSVTTRPMFGNLSAFVNGNMFSGVFGDELFVRVSDEDQARIRKQGGKPFEPMAGREMSGYVIVPPGWEKKPEAARAWVATALAWSKKLPARAAGGAGKAGAKKPSTRKAR